MTSGDSDSPQILDRLEAILAQAEERDKQAQQYLEFARQLAEAAASDSAEAAGECEKVLQLLIEFRKALAEATAFFDSFKKLAALVMVLHDLDSVERLLGRTVDEAIKRRMRVC